MSSSFTLGLGGGGGVVLWESQINSLLEYLCEGKSVTVSFPFPRLRHGLFSGGEKEELTSQLFHHCPELLFHEQIRK